MAVTGGSRAAAAPPLPALVPEAVIAALEALAPQARPYNFDDRFDCWGLVRALYGALLPGRPLDDDLDEATAVEAARARLWAPITEMAELLPGDVVTTHDHHVPGKFHAVVVYGSVAGRLLVYDSSPRGDIPLFEDRDGEPVFVATRALHTRFMRATGGTDRLRNDGGAYLRLWFIGGRYYDRRLHDALLAANPERETDAVALRRRADLAPLPFYAARRLPRDRRRRELYDNRATRALTAYLPDGAPVPDDEYLRARDEGALGGRRPTPPVLVAAPAATHAGGAARLEWSYRPETGERAATGCRVEVHELRRGVWKRLVLAHDCDEPARSFTISAEVLRPDMCYEVSLFARAAAGYSPDTVATFVSRARRRQPLRRRVPGAALRAHARRGRRRGDCHAHARVVDLRRSGSPGGGEADDPRRRLLRERCAARPRRDTRGRGGGRDGVRRPGRRRSRRRHDLSLVCHTTGPRGALGLRARRRRLRGGARRRPRRDRRRSRLRPRRRRLCRRRPAAARPAARDPRRRPRAGGL